MSRMPNRKIILAIVVYCLVVYLVLNAIGLVGIFGFDYYEAKFGGPWENALLNAMFVFPPCAGASTIGFALGHTVIGSGATQSALIIRSTLAGVCSALLAFLPHFVPELLFDWRPSLMLYWVTVGMLAASAGAISHFLTVLFGFSAGKAG